MPEFDVAYEAARSLRRIRPLIIRRVRESCSSRFGVERWVETIEARLAEHWPRFFSLLHRLYGQHYDFFYYLTSITLTAIDCWLERPDDLYEMDQRRENDQDRYRSDRKVGGSLYVDLFAGDLARLRERIPYLQRLGLTYLYLMPLFASRPGNSDGGYAISDYRSVDPQLGTIDDLRALAADLRQAGISLVLDFVFNHTSDEHTWAKRAREGDQDYQNYYRMFPDRNMPDAYERHLREIFPEEHPGAFTYFEDIGKWVWTTFHSNQWDLNYANPEVFNRMADEMLFLANQGVEVLRLDAVAFIWKSMGTSCENLPEAHLIIKAYNAIARIVAPALVFKSEAIVHPDEVAKYIGSDECQLSYNPLLMALLWNTLATREVNLLQYSMQNRFGIPENCAWVNYVRCHDDIGWTFSDEDAAVLGINAFDHRNFLNSFYTGRFEGSFARGLPFQENPKTGDVRISGTCASLAGLEKALKEETAFEIELAIQRILLIHSIILSIGGIPLIYLGDEVGTLNDDSFRTDPAKSDDSRWVHRPPADPKLYAKRKNPGTIPGRIFQGLCRLIQIRKSSPAISGEDPLFIQTGNPHVFGYTRKNKFQHLLILNNFSDFPQSIDHNRLNLFGMEFPLKDLISGMTCVAGVDLELAPFQSMWLKAAR